MHTSLKEMVDRLEVVSKIKEQEVMKKNEAITYGNEMKIAVDKLRTSLDELKVNMMF